MNKPKILLTGSKGFIGTHLKERFVDEVELLTVDHIMLKNEAILRGIVMNFQPTVIIHMASYGNIVTQGDDDETIQANYNNLYNLLKAARNSNYELFVNFSSSSTLLPKQTMYSATKLGGEALCQAYATKYNRNIISVQPYTVIGTGEPKEHLIPTLIRSCMTGEKMKFVGKPVHDFISVDDFITALKLVIEQWHLRGAVPIGTGIKTTNEEILRIVEKVTGKKANIERVDNLRNYDTTEWVADPTLIKSLGWKQEQSLEEVITLMYGAAQKENPGNITKEKT